MQNRNTKQTEVSQKRNRAKGFKRALVFGISAGISTLTWLAFSMSSSSRPSTKEEIAMQMAFQEKWKIEESEATQNWDSTLKADQKTN